MLSVYFTFYFGHFINIYGHLWGLDNCQEQLPNPTSTGRGETNIQCYVIKTQVQTIQLKPLEYYFSFGWVGNIFILASQSY